MPETTLEESGPGTPLTLIHETAKSALDALALALTDHGHKWTDDQRSLYDEAIRLLTL